MDELQEGIGYMRAFDGIGKAFQSWSAAAAKRSGSRQQGHGSRMAPTESPSTKSGQNLTQMAKTVSRDNSLMSGQRLLAAYSGELEQLMDGSRDPGTWKYKGWARVVCVLPLTSMPDERC